MPDTVHIPDCLIVTLEPGMLKQKIAVNLNHHIDSVGSCLMDDIPDTMLNLAEKYNIFDIKIFGATSFATAIQHEILEEAKTSYSNSNIKVEVIEK